MGGSFNPFHLAHLNSLLTVREKFSLEEIVVIPSFQTPLKEGEDMTDSSHRFEMLQQALSSYPFIRVDNQEILRKGVSYTHRTITQFYKKRNKTDLFFIMGLDQFYIFDRWKKFGDILKKTNLIVTSRPGEFFPKKLTDFPKGLKPMIKKRLLKEVHLKETDRKVYFCSLKDMDIASSYLRQRIKEKKEVDHLVPKFVGLYIKENQLYENEVKKQQDQTQKLLEFSIKELKKKKAYDIKTFDLRLKSLPFSSGLIVSGSNTRQTKALAAHLKREIKKKFGFDPISEEGKIESRWIVLDYGDLVVHIFYDYTKKIYKLEELWTTHPSDSLSESISS